MTEKILSILLVEDNAAHVELIRRALEDKVLSNKLNVCESLADARRSIKSSTPSLVIADINLPDGKGTDMIDISHGDNSYPVILMTSYGDEHVAADAIKAGALDYIVKSSDAFINFPLIIDRVMREWQHITAESHAQKALILKEREQEEILNSMADAVMTIDQSGLILTSNNASVLLFGYGLDEIIGQNLRMLITDSDLEQYGYAINRYLQTGDGDNADISDGIELDAKNKQGSTFPMRFTVAELPSINNRRRFIGTCHDLTQIKQQHRQLLHSQKMDALGKLTGGIAHDYNNMLNVIVGFTAILKSELADQPKLIQYTEEIIHAGEHSAKLTQKLLDFSRQKPSDVQMVNINAKLLGLRCMLEKTLTPRIKVIYDLADNLWPALLDSEYLEDAILNISINAMHAMGTGGTLTIQTTNRPINGVEAKSLGLDAGDYVVLSIIDTGSGIDESSKEKIFEPYFTTKGEDGTGLGLSQVYGFVERSNGMIKVYSEVGHGTQFLLYFPQYQHHDPDDINQHAVNDSVNNCGNETILVVDDAPALLKLATEILGRRGYKVICAESAKQGLEVLASESVDLLLSDIIMPEVDGYQLAAIVQQEYPAVKIQLVSGFTDDRHVSMVDDSLHKNMLHKPYEINTLLKTVREVLDM